MSSSFVSFHLIDRSVQFFLCERAFTFYLLVERSLLYCWSGRKFFPVNRLEKNSAQSFGKLHGPDASLVPLLLELGINLLRSLLIAGQFCWAPSNVRSIVVRSSFLFFLTCLLIWAVTILLVTVSLRCSAESLSWRNLIALSERYGFLTRGGIVPRLLRAVCLIVFCKVVQGPSKIMSVQFSLLYALRVSSGHLCSCRIGGSGLVGDPNFH